VDYSPSATIPSGSVVENLKSVLLRHNRAAARSTRPRRPDGCQAITSVSPHANAEEDIHDSRLGNQQLLVKSPINRRFASAASVRVADTADGRRYGSYELRTSYMSDPDSARTEAGTGTPPIHRHTSRPPAHCTKLDSFDLRTPLRLPRWTRPIDKNSQETRRSHFY